MLYGEFIEGTGCKDNEYNYKVYRDLEIMYMNSDMSKAEIYEYGKKLVDNSKSEKELAFEAKIKAEMAEVKEEIEAHKSEITYRERMLEIWKEDDDKEMAKHERRMIKYHKDEIKALRNKLAGLKWVLAD